MANEAEPLDLSIQIVNFNTKFDLVTCLQDLETDLSELKIRWNAIILQNGPTNNLSNLKSEYSNFRFEESPENLGFARGHNLLASLQRSKYLLILNPDIVFLQEKTVERLIESLGIIGAGIVGPALRTPSGNPQIWDHGEFFLENPGLSFYRNLKTPSRVGWVSGACMMMPRSVFDDLGGFDEGFFLYQEDDDICYRATKKGYQVIYNPYIQLQHNSKSFFNKRDYMRQSVDYFLMKHQEDMGPIVYWAKKMVNHVIPY